MKLIKINESQWLITNKKYNKLVSKDWFESSYWQQQKAIDGQSLGRGITYFFHHMDRHYVLREYRRGGLIGKFVENKYIFKNLKSTRAYQELKLLKKLRKLDLPVPKPVAAFVNINGYNYQAKIITRLIKNAEDLFHYLQKYSLTAKEWIEVGILIRRFHQHGVYHSDLNIHNIMKNDSGKLWLIDFDKGQLIKPEHPSLQDNLDRLLRSLRKEKQKQPQFHWQEEDWASFLHGYTATTEV